MPVSAAVVKTTLPAAELATVVPSPSKEALYTLMEALEAGVMAVEQPVLVAVQIMMTILVAAGMSKSVVSIHGL